MTTQEIDSYFRGILDIDGFKDADSSLNGLQVDNDGAPVTKIAFAVDACAETFEQAAASGAGMLFVHHGLYWGAAEPVRGVLRGRLALLFKYNIALYACHLPLDAHPVLGHNAELARLLGLQNPEPFGLYHGKKIGFKGRLEKPLTVSEAAERIAWQGKPPLAVLPFGKERNETCAVISGGAAMEALQAIDAGVDLYVTGEAAHSVYHAAQEGLLNMVSGGHYATETRGLLALAQKCRHDLNIEVEFTDVPTGL